MSDKMKLPIALTSCFYCGEGNGLIISKVLAHEGSDRDKAFKDAMGCVMDMTPCSKCEEYMQRGIILITFDPARSDAGWEKERIPNPYRTGGFAVVKDDAMVELIAAIVRPDHVKPFTKWVLENRYMFLPHDIAEAIGVFDAIEKTKSDGKEGDEQTPSA